MSFVSALACLSLTLACSFVACTSDDTDGAGTSSGTSGSSADAGGDSDTGTPSPSPSEDSGATPDGGGACNTLENVGTQIAEVAGGTKPTPQGGTIADGTYVLTKHEVYPPSSPDENTRRRVFKFAGGTFDVVMNDANQPETRISGTFTTSGTNLELTAQCPTGLPGVALGYTATEDTIVMFDLATDTDIFTYTKQ